MTARTPSSLARPRLPLLGQWSRRCKFGVQSPNAKCPGPSKHTPHQQSHLVGFPRLCVSVEILNPNRWRRA